MDLSYPIGRFDFKQVVTPDQYPRLIEEIANAPARLRDAVRGLDETQLDTPYRPGGWTVRQTVHHLADSHMNSFMRWRLALTEPEPTIRPYDQAAWGELADSRVAPVELSLHLIENLHGRWRSTPGTAGTIRPTSPGYAKETAGNKLEPNRPPPRRISIMALELELSRNL